MQDQKVEIYLAKAEAADTMAECTADALIRKSWLQIADSYRQLAEKQVKHADIKDSHPR